MFVNPLRSFIHKKSKWVSSYLTQHTMHSFSSCPDCSKRVTKKVSKGHFEEYEQSAAEVTLNTGYTSCDCVGGVGIVERRIQENGKYIYTVVPNTQYNRRQTILQNFSEECIHLKKKMKKLLRLSTSQHAFHRGLPAITPECVHGPSYYFEDGFRKVTPYYFVFYHMVTSVQGNVTLLDYQRRLLPRVDESFLKYRIEEGLVCVNFEPRGPNHLVRNGDFITNVSHYHETPVLDSPINIIFEDKDMLVVDKPGGFHIYPSANQRLNSLVFVLAKEKGYMNLRPAHRLDKHTSGVCIFSKNSASSRHIHKTFQEEASSTKKTYLALVEGSFPEKEIIMMDPIEGHYLTSTVMKRFKEPKESTTKFERLEYNGKTSLILCTPLTGRTHQIRIHLQKLGFPILGDYLYNHTDRLIRYEDDNALMSEKYLQTINGTPSEQGVSRFSSIHDEESWQYSLSNRVGLNAPGCFECTLGEAYLRQRALKSVSIMCLHSWKYQIGKLHLQSQLPRWATDSDFVNELLKKRAGNLALNECKTNLIDADTL